MFCAQNIVAVSSAHGNTYPIFSGLKVGINANRQFAIKAFQNILITIHSRTLLACKADNYKWRISCLGCGYGHFISW